MVAHRVGVRGWVVRLLKMAFVVDGLGGGWSGGVSGACEYSTLVRVVWQEVDGVGYVFGGCAFGRQVVSVENLPACAGSL